MTFKDLLNKIVGKWTQFAISDKGQRIITRTKSFIWRYGAFLIVMLLAYFVEKILPTWNMSPAFVALIAYIVNEITKDVMNQRTIGKAGVKNEQ
jgi:hypothetical protein